MANVMFKKGLLANLPETHAEGTFYVTTDERAIYLDVSDSARIRLGDFQEFANVAALEANTNPSTSALYYVTDINCLAKWNGAAYVQINRDTGFTSFEIVGDGNAVTAIAVDETDARKLVITKGATYMTAADVDGKIAAVVGEIPADGEGAARTVREYIDDKTSGIATDTALGELQDRVTTAEGEIDALQDDSHTHTNKDELDLIVAGDKAKWDAEIGSAAAIAAMKDGATVVTFKGVEDAIAGAKTELQGYADTAEADALQAAKEYADGKVASVTAGDASVAVGGTATAPTIAAKLSQDSDNALALVDDGLKVVIPAAAEYSIVKDETSADYAAVYHLTKDGTNVGAAINIPKDMVVQSGSVVENPEGQTAGTYIELVLQNVDEPLYINVGDLIEYVTSGSAAGDMVVIAVSDDHKVTASITDGSITLAKLEADVQTAIGKAHVHENADVINGISADDVAAWDAAEGNAKTYADGLNTAMNTRVEVVEGKAHEHANKALLDTYTQTEADLADAVAKKHEHANAEELAKIADGDKAKWDAAEQNAKNYADGLAGNYDAAGSAAAAQAAAEKTAADALAAATAWGSF